VVISNHSQQSISSQNEVIHPTSKTAFCPAAKPLLAIPIPAAPRVFASYYSVPMANEVLNPDVPEFIPMETSTERTNGFTGESNETATNESNETQNEIQFETIKEEIDKLTNSLTMPLVSPNNNSPIKMDDTLPITAGSSTSDLLEERINRESDTSSDNAWKEVIIFIVFIIYFELYLENL